MIEIGVAIGAMVCGAIVSVFLGRNSTLKAENKVLKGIIARQEAEVERCIDRIEKLREELDELKKEECL